MATNKMQFYILLDNGQYVKASDEVIKSSQKMQREAGKSMTKWEQEAKRAGNRMREHLSLAAIVGVGFSIANRVINSFFSAIGKGIENAKKGNAELKKSFDDINTRTETVFTKIGEKLSPVLLKISEFLLTILENFDKVTTKIGSILNPKGTVSGIKGIIEKDKKEIEDYKNYLELNYDVKNMNPKSYYALELTRLENILKKDQEILSVLEKQESANKKISNSTATIKDNTEEKLRLEKLATEEKEKQDKIQELYNILLETEQKLKENQVDNQTELNSLVKNTANELTNSIIEGSALASAFKDSASQAYELGKNLVEINRLLQTGASVASGDLLSIMINIVSIIISIGEEVLTIKNNEEDLLLIEEKMNIEISKRKDDLEEIERLTNNARLQNELDILQGADKAKQIQNQKDLIEKYNDALEKQNEIIDKAKGLGSEAGVQSDINKAKYELADLQKTQKGLNVFEKLIFGNYYRFLINAKQNEISKLETNLELIQDGNQAETDRLQTLIDIENSKAVIAELETVITDEMEKQTDEMKTQLDLLKKYIDLGLDLENIRTVKQITKGLASQGYTGANLGVALQDIGVQTRAISGKTLNIYGDINNTLNQGTANMLISQMNSLINNIGGV